MIRNPDIRKTTNLDVEIGAKIKKSRIFKLISQRDLADKIGITAQQIHKYETGDNRIAIGTLVRILSALDFNGAYISKEGDVSWQ